MSEEKEKEPEVMTEKVISEAEELPKAIVRRVVKDKLSKLSTDYEIQILRDSLLAFSESARIFIHYLSAAANDVCKESKRQIINAEDVFNALEEIEFPEFAGPLRAALEEFRQKNALKKSAASKAKDANNNAENKTGPSMANGSHMTEKRKGRPAKSEGKKKRREEESSKDDGLEDESNTNEGGEDDSSKDERREEESTNGEGHKDESTNDGGCEDESNTVEENEEESNNDEGHEDESTIDGVREDESSADEEHEDESIMDEDCEDESNRDEENGN